MPHRERRPLGLAALHHIPRLQVALPMLATLAIPQVRIPAIGVDMCAVDIEPPHVQRREVQPRHPIGPHVQVIACLPGLLVRGVEVRHLHGVGNEDCPSRHVVERGVAVDLLPAKAETVRPLAVARDQAPGGVVDAPGQRLASVCGAVQVEVQADAASVIQRMAEGTAQVVLVPAVFVARGIQAATERCAGVPDHTGQVETVALLAVGVVHHEALVVAGGIAVGAFVEVPGQQLERVELVAGEEEPCSGFG